MSIGWLASKQIKEHEQKQGAAIEALEEAEAICEELHTLKDGE